MEVDVSTVETLNRALDYSIFWREDTQKRKSFAKLLKNRLQGKDSELLLPLVVLCQTRLETVEVMKCLDEEFPKCTHASLTVETPLAERRRTIEEFQQSRLKVLVSTPGIVGRGIELQAARCVAFCGGDDEQILMWSFASSISEFIHHAGRVGRAGERGSVCVFCNARNKKLFPAFVKLCEENGIALPAGSARLSPFLSSAQEVHEGGGAAEHDPLPQASAVAAGETVCGEAAASEPAKPLRHGLQRAVRSQLNKLRLPLFLPLFLLLLLFVLFILSLLSLLLFPGTNKPAYNERSA